MSLSQCCLSRGAIHRCFKQINQFLTIHIYTSGMQYTGTTVVNDLICLKKRQNAQFTLTSVSIFHLFHLYFIVYDHIDWEMSPVCNGKVSRGECVSFSNSRIKDACAFKFIHMCQLIYGSMWVCCVPYYLYEYTPDLYFVQQNISAYQYSHLILFLIWNVWNQSQCTRRSASAGARCAIDLDWGAANGATAFDPVRAWPAIFFLSSHAILVQSNRIKVWSLQHCHLFICSARQLRKYGHFICPPPMFVIRMEKSLHVNEIIYRVHFRYVFSLFHLLFTFICGMCDKIMHAKCWHKYIFKNLTNRSLNMVMVLKNKIRFIFISNKVHTTDK